MKNRSVLLLTSIILLGFGCKKQAANDCLQVKVIRITCASTVLQVLNNDAVGADGWADIYNNNARYDNVFSASNACHIPSEYKVGNVLYVTVGKTGVNDCVQCALYDAPPASSYEVKTMGNLPCGELK